MTNINFQNFKPGGLVTFFIAGTVVFGAISLFLHHAIEKLPDALKWLTLFTDAFTVPTFFFFFFAQIEKKWWHYKLLHFLIESPNMNGRYEGILTSSYIENGIPKKMTCIIEINQSASNINIFGYFQDPEHIEKKSSSVSSLEKITKKSNGFFEFYYNFSNSNGTLEDLLKGHIGTARFDYFPDKQELNGEYYNVKGNTGKIVVSKVSDQLMGRH